MAALTENLLVLLLITWLPGLSALPSVRSLQQTENGLNTTTLLCPQGTFISAVRGLADLQLQALQIACGPISQSSFTASWGTWNLLGPQALGTVLWAPSDARAPMTPIIFWFNCEEGFDALRQTPTGAGAAGPVSTLAWHCSSNSQWTYPSVARATVNPPTDVSNCTALNNSTGLQGQQLRMVGISLAWQPAVTGMGSVVDIVPICDWVTASTTSPPAPVPQIPQGAVALPVLTSSLYDSYPENVGNLPTPVLCPAGEYVVGITAWTTFVFSTLQLSCSGGTTLPPIGLQSLQHRNIPCRQTLRRSSQGDKWLGWCTQGIQAISMDWSSTQAAPMGGLQTMCVNSSRWGPWSALWENLGSSSQGTQPKLGAYPAYTCPAGTRLIGLQTKVSQRVDLTGVFTGFSRFTIPSILTYQWSVISALGAVCAPVPEVQPPQPAAQQSLGLNTPASTWGLPNGTAPTGYTLGSMGVPRATSQAEQALSALSPAPQPSSVTQGGTNSSSSTSSFTSAMVCSGSGSYVQSISFIFSQLPRLPWLVTCSGGEEHLVGLPPATSADTSAATAAVSSLSSPTCDKRVDVDVLATESVHALSCVVGIDGLWSLASASGELAPLQLAFKCRHTGLYPLVLGNAWTAPSVSSFKACPPGQVISGISVAAGPFQPDPSLTVVNGIAFKCSTPSLPASLSLPLLTPAPGATVLPAFGRNLPDSQPYAMPFSLSCPPGAYITTVYGLAQQLIGTMSIVCSGKQAVTVGPAGLLMDTTFYATYQLACAGGFTAIRAVDDGGLRSVNRLSLFCSGPAQGWSSNDGIGIETDTNIPYASKAPTTSYSCPASSKVVGLRGIISYYEGDPGAELAITQLQAVCDDPASGGPTPPADDSSSDGNHDPNRDRDDIPGAGIMAGPPQPPADLQGAGTSSTAAIAGGAAGAGAALVIVVGLAIWMFRLRRQQQEASEGDPSLPGQGKMPGPQASTEATNNREDRNGKGTAQQVGCLSPNTSLMYSTTSYGAHPGTAPVSPTAQDAEKQEAATGQEQLSKPSKLDGANATNTNTTSSHQQLANPSPHPGPSLPRHIFPAPVLPAVSMGSQEQSVPTVHGLVSVKPGQLDQQQQQVLESTGGNAVVLVDAQRLLGTGCYGWVYEGRLNGMPVAVKLLVPATEGASRQDGFITTPGSPHPPAPLPSSATLDPGSEQLAGSPPPQAQVHQEVEALTQLQHPHILRLLGISSSLAPPARRQQLGGQGTNAAGKVPFLVYELVKGGTLAAAIHRDASHAAGAGDGPAGPILLPLAQILMVTASIADALAYMCGRGWVHKDVKPSNILVPLLKEEEEEHQGQQHRGRPPPLAFHAAKLSDFGLATRVAPRPIIGRMLLPSPFAAGRPVIPPSPFAGAVPAASAAPVSHKPSSGVLTSSDSIHGQGESADDGRGGGDAGNNKAGTVAYAAPEVLDPGRGPVTPAADVWSLGVVMWECLTGQRPWQGHTSGAIMTAVAIQGRHLPVPEGDSERFPPGVTTLLEGCWATDASSRLSASEVAARCRQLLGQLINTKGEDLEE